MRVAGCAQRDEVGDFRDLMTDGGATAVPEKERDNAPEIPMSLRPEQR